MSSTPATRQRRFWLASSFLVPIVSLGMSGAQAQQAPAEQLPPIEVTSPTDPNRTRARPTYDEGIDVAPRRAGRCAVDRHAARSGDRLERRIARRLARRGRKRRPAILRHRRHVVDRYYRRRDRAFAVANAARDHRAGAGRAVDQSFFGGVNGAKTSVDLRGFGAFATANTLILINGRRLNDIDMAGVDLSTIPRRFDRAHRNHARQQRRGALRRQRGRRRHQYRPEERRRRPTRCHARRGRRRLLQPAPGQSLGGDQLRDRGRPRSTATPSSPTAIATTTRSTSATASATSITPRPTSRRS